MRKTLRKFSVIFFSIFFVLLYLSAASAEIKLGILPRLSASEMSAMFRPLAEYLSKELGETVTRVIPKDYETFKSMLAAEQMDIALSNPIIYIQLKKNLNLESLALMAEEKGGARFRGIIITRKDSGIEKLQDLKGKKLVFVDKNAAGGYIFQMALLKREGIDVKKDFTLLPFAKKHDNVAVAVFNKTADAGGIREDDFSKMKDKVDISQIKVIAFTEYYPNHVMLAPPKLNRGKVEKIKTALLRLVRNDPDSEKVLSAARIVGFSPVVDKDFDKLREAAKLVDAF